MHGLKTFQFPEDFILGVADADLQVIGEDYTLKEENSELSMWTHFAEKSGRVFQNQTPRPGINRYNMFEADVDLMVQLGIKHYRTSVSMCRVMNQDRTPNMAAINWYKNLFTKCREEGIQVFVTLYHWELPQYLSEIGGLKNKEIANYFVSHAEIVHEHLDEYIEEYFLINEPFQSTFESYHAGVHAPGENDLEGALHAVHNLLFFQGLMFQTLKSRDSSVKVSTVFNPSVVYAASASDADNMAAEMAYCYHTSIFTDPLFCGYYPEMVHQKFSKILPDISDEDLKVINIGAGLENFGINYYRGKVIEYDENSDVFFKEKKYPQGICNGLQWPVFLPPTYPDGLYDLLCKLYHSYRSHGLKGMYIAENGTCWNDAMDQDGTVNDDFRIFYLKEHMAQVQKAMMAGVPMKGYFLWTFMDNYEWDLGYKPESSFGIVKIDRETMKRTPKKSFHWYKDVIKSRTLSN